MAFRVPTKRGSSSSRSSNFRGGGQSSVIRSSPTLRAHTKRRLRQPATSRGSLRAPSRRESSAPSSSHLVSEHINPHPGGGQQRSPETAPEQDGDVEEREDDDSLNEVIMAVDLRDRGTIGCAYYVAREEKIYMMEDIRFGGTQFIETCKSLMPMIPNHANTQKVKLHAQPTVVLLSARVDEGVDAFLEPSRGSKDLNYDHRGGESSPRSLIPADILLPQPMDLHPLTSSKSGRLQSLGTRPD